MQAPLAMVNIARGSVCREAMAPHAPSSARGKIMGLGGRGVRRRDNRRVASAVLSHSPQSLQSQDTTLEETNEAALWAQAQGWMQKHRQQEGAELATVQMAVQIKVVFKLKLAVEFGESLRLIGGHEALGAWSLPRAVHLHWSPGDVWVTDPVEMPVDGVFVYKYYKCAGANAQPVAWQQGNNQVLVLSPEDAPVLEVMDNWRGDPSSACTSAPDGSRRMQTESRLVHRVREADHALHEAQAQIAALQEELRDARLQSKALREEARLGANVRLALKDQLRIEKKRNTILEQQVDAWRHKALTMAPKASAAMEAEA